MNAFRFHDPWWLLLLLPALAVGIHMVRRERKSAVTYSSVAPLKQLPVTLAQRLRRYLPWLRLVGISLIVVGIARPQFGREEF